MKKKLIYASLLIVCISFFSFKEIGQCNMEAAVKKNLPKKNIPASINEEWKLSPFYNFLKI
ncbi:MAG TPA: hypothetical protein VGQ09_10050 [Chitinophagaceae bacterium]|jgi:hypothetical protein|nr:hypothetical protein [Chitinophagaceae bacterium]